MQRGTIHSEVVLENKLNSKSITSAHLRDAIKKARSAYMWRLDPLTTTDEYKDMPESEFSKLIWTYGLWDKRSHIGNKLNERLPDYAFSNEDAIKILKTILIGKGNSDDKKCFKYYLLAILLNRKAETNREAEKMITDILNQLRDVPCVPLKFSDTVQGQEQASSAPSRNGTTAADVIGVVIQGLAGMSR